MCVIKKIWKIFIFIKFIITILLYLEFFTPALADGFSPEFGWHQVSPSLQDSSLYSGRQYSSLDSHYLSSDF